MRLQLVFDISKTVGKITPSLPTLEEGVETVDDAEEISGGDDDNSDEDDLSGEMNARFLVDGCPLSIAGDDETVDVAA